MLTAGGPRGMLTAGGPRERRRGALTPSLPLTCQSETVLNHKLILK